MAARYPEDPTQEYKDKVKQFIYLLSELYPCGQCATHFQKFLVDNPPEVFFFLFLFILRINSNNNNYNELIN